MNRRKNSQSAWGAAGYRSSGYAFVFPEIEKAFINYIRKNAFPKRIDSNVQSMIKFVKSNCLKIIEKELKQAGIYTQVRDAIDKLSFSAFIYIKAFKTADFEREVGDIVVTSYPDKIRIPISALGISEYATDEIDLALAGYFYK